MVWMRDWEKRREDWVNETSFESSFRISLAISRQICHLQRTRQERKGPWFLI